MKEPNIPKVTVGVPVYNGAPHIRESLQCIAQQTYPNFEVIISDNCSTDETQAICQTFAERDKRFRYIRQEKNLGLFNNFDYVLREAEGDYFCWRAADDLSDENFLETLANALTANPDAWMAVTDTCWTDHIANYQKRYPVTTTQRFSQYLQIRQQILDVICFWFYHMHRRTTLLNEWKVFHDTIGAGSMHCDVLFLTHFITLGRVTSVTGSTLYSQRLAFKPYRFENAPISEFRDCIRTYNAIVRKNLATLRMPIWHRAILKILAFRHLDRRVVRLKPYMKKRLKILLGEQDYKTLTPRL